MNETDSNNNMSKTISPQTNKKLILTQERKSLIISSLFLLAGLIPLLLMQLELPSLDNKAYEIMLSVDEIIYDNEFIFWDQFLSRNLTHDNYYATPSLLGYFLLLLSPIMLGMGTYLTIETRKKFLSPIKVIGSFFIVLAFWSMEVVQLFSNYKGTFFSQIDEIFGTTTGMRFITLVQDLFLSYIFLSIVIILLMVSPIMKPKLKKFVLLLVLLTEILLYHILIFWPNSFSEYNITIFWALGSPILFACLLVNILIFRKFYSGIK